MLIRIAAVLLAMAAGPALAGNFCAVTSAGAQCHYPSISACQQALIGMDGQCVVNPDALQSGRVSPAPSYQPAPPATPPPGWPNGGRSFMDSAERGMAAGRRARMEREEHEARMALLRAQTEAIRDQPGTTTQQSGQGTDWEAVTKKAVEMYKGEPVYNCAGKVTRVPDVGCTVVGFMKKDG